MIMLISGTIDALADVLFKVLSDAQICAFLHTFYINDPLNFFRFGHGTQFWKEENNQSAKLCVGGVFELTIDCVRIFLIKLTFYSIDTHFNTSTANCF